MSTSCDNYLDTHRSNPLTDATSTLAQGDGSMVLRWSAAAFEATEKSFRRIHGYRDLWMLQAHVDAATDAAGQDRKAG